MLQSSQTVKQQQLYATKNEQYPECIDGVGILPNFIQHPSTFPLSYKRIWLDPDKADQKTIGLCFNSEKYFKPGVTIEVSIPLRGEVQRFKGKVVLVMNMDDHFKIGMWLKQPEDVHRMRAVEQVCHIETYVKVKRRQDGPFVSAESITKEWINKYATNFPTAKS